MWLLHMEETDGVKIMYGREYKVPELTQFSVDGYCPETRTIYEFLDVIFTVTRVNRSVTFQCECDFDESDIVKQKPQLLTHPIVQQTPLRTRDALYGGRTEAMCLYRKGRENETIQYVDVMSLYPYICKYLKFPIGHPVIHVGEACRDIEACLSMEGLIRCSIVPPDKLYHPVLPYRCNNKLIFCLCRTCVHTSSEECTHTEDEDRAQRVPG